MVREINFRAILGLTNLNDFNQVGESQKKLYLSRLLNPLSWYVSAMKSNLLTFIF